MDGRTEERAKRDEHYHVEVYGRKFITPCNILQLTQVVEHVTNTSLHAGNLFSRTQHAPKQNINNGHL